MNRKTPTALLVLALSCAAGLTGAGPAVADDPVPDCLNITSLVDWSLAQDSQGAWTLTVTQELAGPSCPGGATYSLHTVKGNTGDAQEHSAPTGLGTNQLTFSVPVEVYEITCTQLGLVDHTRLAVKAYATTERGSRGDVTSTGTFNTDPELCGPPGAAGWS